MEQKEYNDQPEPRSDYAPLMRRFIAFLIDCFLLGAVFIAMRVAFPSVWRYGADFVLGRNLFEVVLVFAYFTYFDSEKKGGSLGKQTMSMQVLGADDRPLPLPKAALRAISKIVISWIPLVWLFPLFSRYRQALHDLVVGSYVMDDSLSTPTRRYE